MPVSNELILAQHHGPYIVGGGGGLPSGPVWMDSIFFEYTSEEKEEYISGPISVDQLFYEYASEEVPESNAGPIYVDQLYFEYISEESEEPLRAPVYVDQLYYEYATEEELEITALPDPYSWDPNGPTDPLTPAADPFNLGNYATGYGVGTWGYSVTASSEIAGGYYAWQAANNAAPYWQCAAGQNIGAWLMFDMINPVVMSGMKLQGGANVVPRNFKIEAANTLGSWTTLLTVTDYPNVTTLSSLYNLNNGDAYRYYRLISTLDYHGSYVGINELLFFAGV